MKLLTQLKHFFKEYQLPILSGILIGTSYIPFPPWASFFGLVPLWIYWTRQTQYKKIFISGWLTQFILTAIGFSWIAFNIHEHANLPWSVSILGMMIFCSFANYYIPLSGLIWRIFTRKTANPTLIYSLLLLGSLTAICEIYFQTIFQWNFGYTFLWSRWPIFQLAEFIGFQGLSSFVILMNSLFLWIYLNRKKNLAFRAIPITIIFILALNGLGWHLSKRWDPTDHILNPMLVQANISNQQKVYAEQGKGFREFILNKFLEMSLENYQKNNHAKLIVWPETAFPDYLNFENSTYTKNLKSFLIENNLSLITGAYYRDLSLRKSANAMFFLNNQGEIVAEPYLKTHLLAFGEYIPGVEIFPILQKWLPMVANFKRGEGPTSVELIETKFGPQICYESLDPSFSRGLAIKESDIIVNVTNDSWFGWWQEPYQHLTMTLARGIEFRRPVIRSTNTGISTVMLANGEILETSPIGVEWAHTYELKFKKKAPATFYQKYFNLIPSLMILLTLILLFQIWRLRERN